MHNDVYDIKKEEVINDLLVKYETEKKENEVKLKNEQIKLEKIKSRNRNIVIALLSGIILLIIIVAIFYSASN